MMHVNKLKIEQNVVDEYHPLSSEEKIFIESQSELVQKLESDPHAEIDARVIAFDPITGKTAMKRIGKAEFIESSKLPDSDFEGVRLREGIDSYSTDVGDLPNTGFVGGEDFVPLLGGAFYRQLYQLDYIKQANAAFYAYNHDPLAHASINILSDFTLGRGYRVDSDNAAALALWRAFEKVNRLPEQMLQVSKEIAIYGESMIWWLPDNQTKIVQRPYPGQVIPKGLIPRIRLIDPTNIYEVVTQPEDITAALFYVWLAPTQYQVYSGLEKNMNVPTAKFIFQQIPADQMDHYKVNAVSNEKRGRSDLFPVMGYLKRLRDSVNYSIIALQKQSAFCVDTIVRGSQADLQAYIEDQQSYGTIAPAGSEFVHTDAIERKYMGVEGGKGGHSTAFEWAFSMFCAGIGIPTSYFGTHLSGGQTRASAIVATEPVAKRFEQRQQVFERMLQDQWDRLMEWAGLGSVECEISFPELITQDRSQKLKDLALAESQRWLSNKTAGSLAGKEFGITTYEWDLEQKEIDQEHAEGIDVAPLTSPGMSATPQPDSAQQAVTGTERKAIKSYG
jgi:hypothetical protein